MSEKCDRKRLPPKLHYKVGVVRLQMVKGGRSLYGMEQINGPKTAAEVVAVGSLDTCSVSMRELFKHAILSNAARILCFHNHPSGDPKPSEMDLGITKRMIEAGAILGIPLDDHIILGDKEFVSLKYGGHGNLWANAP